MFLIPIWLVGAVMSWPLVNKQMEASEIDEYAINGLMCLMWPILGLGWVFGRAIKLLVERK